MTLKEMQKYGLQRPTLRVTELSGGGGYSDSVSAVIRTSNLYGQNTSIAFCGSYLQLYIIQKQQTTPPTTIGPGDKADTTTEYEDSNGDTAVIPGDFTISGLEEENKIDDGLVIYLIPDGETVDWTNPTEVANAQKTYDQFVWIPISHTQINNMYICQAKTGSNGNCNIEVVNGEAKCTVHNSTQMAGRLYATDLAENFEKGYTEVYKANTGLREPDILTDSTNGDGNSTYLTQLSSILGTTGYNTTANFKQSLQTEYNEVVKSVYENQGFYIGRYETSNMVDSNTNTTVKTVAGTTTGISGVTWYRMYAQQKKYAENNALTSVRSTMIQPEFDSKNE